MELKTYADGLDELKNEPQAGHKRHALLAEAFTGDNGDVSKLAAKELSAVLILLSDIDEPREEGYPTIAEAEMLLTATDATRKKLTSEQKRAVNCLIMDFYNSGDEDKKAWAKETFMSRNQGFIGKMISKHFPSYCNNYYDDLYQQGCIAVLETLPRFDPRRSETGSSTSFFTYPIINKIYEYVNYETNRTNPYYSGLIKKVTDAQQRLFSAGVEEPTAYQISVQAGMSMAQVTVALYMADTADMASLEESEETMKRLASSSDPLNEILDREQTQVLTRALRRDLSSQAIKCVCMRHGIGCDPMSDKAISKALRISTSQINDLINKALTDLRNDTAVAALVGLVPRPSGGGRDLYDDTELDSFDDLDD